MLIRQETVEFVISNTREREVRKGSGVGGGGGGLYTSDCPCDYRRCFRVYAFLVSEQAVSPV